MGITLSHLPTAATAARRLFRHRGADHSAQTPRCALCCTSPTQRSSRWARPRRSRTRQARAVGARRERSLSSTVLHALAAHLSSAYVPTLLAALQWARVAAPQGGGREAPRRERATHRRGNCLGTV